METIKLIAHLQWQRLRLSISETTAHLFQRLAIQLCKGMLACGLWVPPVMVPSIHGVVEVIMTLTILSCFLKFTYIFYFCLFIIKTRQD